jgi:hypothetical protein
MTHRSLLGLVALAAAPVALAAQAPRPLPLKHAPRPTAAAISEADLMTRLYVVADDSMMGREAGTEGGVKGTAYIARELQRMGLRPAGDNGTFFQEIPLYKRSLDAASTVSVDGGTLPSGGWLARDQGAGARPFDGAQAIFGGTWGTPATLISAEEAAGKVVVLAIPNGPDGRPAWSVNRGQVVRRFPNAAAIAVASLDHIPAQIAEFFRAPSTDMKDDATPAAVPSWIYVSSAAAEQILGTPVASATRGQAGRTLRGRIAYREEKVPARNVVAILPGSDPALRGQYVAIGSHSDHVGLASSPVDHDSLRAFNRVMRPNGAEDQGGTPTAEQAARIRAVLDSLRARGGPRADSVYNGADDDGSGTVAMLEIAEALKAMNPAPKRSILLIWHTAEELGLLGAMHYTDHPTVPLDSIVTALNIDMIGRGSETDLPGGGPRYLQLIGSKRLSTELGALVETVNGRQAMPFQIDYTYDADGHPANYYCRSDHYAYARFGIPITFFSTGGHQDYHMLTDEPQYIDYPHLARVTTLIRDVAVAVANQANRPVVDRPVPDRNQPCRQ